jgi:IclR family transcriptional regulator, pca regulon regulatory protein
MNFDDITLERSLDLPFAISESPSGLAAKEIIHQMGIPPATCYRILRTLSQKPLLYEHRDGRYLIGYGLALLSRASAELEARLAEIQPRLKELSRKTGLSGKISIREGADAVVVLRSDSHRANAITSPVGTKMPLLEAGSVGIMPLASVPVDELRFLLRGSRSRTRMLSRNYSKPHARS